MPEHLVDDEWPLPRWRELVSVLAALNSLEDQVSDVELTRTYYDNPPRKIEYYHLRPIHFGH
jgi:hypothetical protein